MIRGLSGAPPINILKNLCNFDKCTKIFINLSKFGWVATVAPGALQTSMMALHLRTQVGLPGLCFRGRASVRCPIRSRYTAVVKEDCRAGPV
jgi:hypothetical protein